MKNKIKLLKVRLITAWQILFGSNGKHWFVVWLTTDELKKHFTGELDEFNMSTHMLLPYNAKTIIQSMANGIDKDEMILEKASFEGEAEFRVLSTQKH